MLRDERDYILRMIAAAAAMVGKLRERLTRGASGDEIVTAARAAQGELLGKDATLLRSLDPASAAQILGKERLPAWADLLQLEADGLRAAGKTADADAAEQRVRVLRDKAKE